jgi:uncharacterized delta-60 repeat protein
MKKLILLIVVFTCFLSNIKAQPGSLDLSFNPPVAFFGGGTGANDVVHASAIQSDGKIIIGGAFTLYKGISKNHIVRLNEDESIDATFGIGTGANGNVYNVYSQTNGKVLIGGNFTTYNGNAANHISRINANGSFDNTFNTGIGANGIVNCICGQSDGKIMIGGQFTSFNGVSRNRIARLNDDGSIDTTFNPGTGANDVVESIVVQLDGKIIIGGSFYTYKGVGRNGIARLNSDGSLDASFNPGSGANNSVMSICLQGDGKIIVGGLFNSFNGSTRRGIARLNANGSLDVGFNLGSWDYYWVFTTSLQNDGKIIIGGQFNVYNNAPKNNIARLNPNGSLDTTFCNGTGTNDIGIVYTSSVQNDVQMVIGGDFTSYNGSVRKDVARLNPNGNISTDYYSGTGPDNSVLCTRVLNNGKIIFGGNFSSYNQSTASHIACVYTDGRLDSTFVTGTGANGAVETISVQNDGKILIGGNFTSYQGTTRNRLGRINANGTIDNSFNPGTGADDYVYCSAIQSDNKIIVGGDFISFNGTTMNHIARLNSNGSLDAGFATGTGANGRIKTTSVQNDGKIIIGGSFTSYNDTAINNLARLNVDGSLDTTFKIGIGASSMVYSTALQSDGKIIIGGAFTSYNGIITNHIARLYSDGTLDTLFNTGTGISGLVSSILVQSDGKIIVGGTFSSINGTIIKYIARLNSDGSLDTTFVTGANSAIYSIALQNDDKIIIGGAFSLYSGVSKKSIARLHNNIIHITSLSPISYCQGGNMTVSYSASGIYNCGNIFTVQLSDSAGSFVSPTNIGSMTTNTAGNIVAAIPVNQPTGNRYRVRVISSSPAVIGADNGINLTVNAPTSSEISEVHCDSYTAPDGMIHTTSGTKTAIIPNSVGCDSVITIHLTINNSSSISISEIACNSYTAPDGTVYTTSGTKTAVIPNSVGCDSTITILLTINNSTTSDISVTACDSYTAPDGAVYVTSGIKTSVIPNSLGCDSTMTIHLVINNSTTSDISVTACDSYTAPDGAVYVTSGTKTAVIPNSLGCDSTITVHLTINNSTTSDISVTACDSYTAPDGTVYLTSGTKTAVIPNSLGCDSTITVHLTINNRTSSDISVTACDSYTAPDGAVYTTSGIKTAIIPNSVGCDSTITIHLTINNRTSSDISVTACDSYTAPDGSVYTTSGIKTAVISNSVGCDSTITIHLTINNSTTSDILITACDSYTAPDGSVYTTSGIKTAVISNSVGCDSTITIHLTINNSTSSDISVTACNSYTAPDGAVYSTFGIKTAVIPNSLGCDSTITVHLTINNSTTSDISVTVCDSYTAPDGAVYMTSGIKTAVIPNSVGCDSTMTIHLTINNSTSSDISVTACDSYTAPDGVVYATSGIKTAVIPNSQGCDSTITIHLVINTADASVTNNDPTLVANASNATYQWIFCSSGMSVPNQTSQSFTPLVDGYYACVITQFGCTATSECNTVMTLGMTGNTLGRNIVLYPNPVSTELVIEMKGAEQVDFEIHNIIGQIVYKGTFVEKTTIPMGEFAPGIYVVKLENGKAIEFVNVIKE